jgi:hypothetical protein
LALTEARPAQRGGIEALLVKDAVFDWSGVASQPQFQSCPQDPTLCKLYSLRETLFPSPASAFDAFASPLLFFRTTGLAIPGAWPKAPSSPLSEAEVAKEESRVGNGNGTGAGYATRKSHLTFPPKRSGLRIPWTRIAVTKGDVTRTSTEGDGNGEREGDEKAKVKGKGKRKAKGKAGGEGEGESERGILKAQAEEMVKLMRRSIVLHESKERRDIGAAFDGVLEAERRVGMVELEPKSGDGEVDDGEWAAEYLEEMMGVD